MMRLAATAMVTLGVALSSVLPIAAAPVAPPTEVLSEDYIKGAWLFYRSKFVDGDGRVIDGANGDISHSEGQGSGMLLAVAADEQRTFDQIWEWTQANLISARSDGLAAWKWDPNSDTHVADTNNATDGDLLIAWALLRAYKRWGKTEYFDSAHTIASAIAKDAVESNGTNTILLPGATGFSGDDREDGPIVNLSYWVFPAIDELSVYKDFPSKALIATGLSLLDQSQFGPAKLAADWISLAEDKPAPADKFPATFGYDAIRIPLYLAWYQAAGTRPLEPYVAMWSKSDASISVVDLTSGKPIAPLGDAGYRAIADLVLCSVGKHPLGTPAQNFNLTQYYPSTLDMLSLLAIVERYPRCLTAS